MVWSWGDETLHVLPIAAQCIDGSPIAAINLLGSASFMCLNVHVLGRYAYQCMYVSIYVCMYACLHVYVHACVFVLWILLFKHLRLIFMLYWRNHIDTSNQSDTWHRCMVGMQILGPAPGQNPGGVDFCCSNSVRLNSDKGRITIAPINIWVVGSRKTRIIPKMTRLIQFQIGSNVLRMAAQKQ